MNNSRKDEMSVFLRQLFKNAPKKNFNYSIIYNLMKTYSLKNTDVEYFEYKGLNVEFLFKKWLNYFKDKDNIDAFTDERNPYFLHFSSKKRVKRGEYLKLHIPVDYEHLEEGVELLFDFLDKENIKHISKVAKEMRSDNVIIRINKNDIESLRKIVDFINENVFFKDAFNDTNPFIPKYGNIGIMRDHGDSYTRSICFYIADYIRLARSSNQTSVSAEDFYIYLNNCANNNICFDDKEEFDYTMFKTFQVAYYGHDIEKVYLKDEKISVFNYEQKRVIFMEIIYNTFKHYSIKQVIGAIIKIIEDNDYDYLTSKGCSYDTKTFLKENVSSEEVLSFIDNYLANINSDINTYDIKAKVSLFVNSIYKNDLSYMFDEVCDVTLSKYGNNVLYMAINRFIKEGFTKSFSRYNKNKKENYRSKLSKFDRRYMYEVMKESLLNKGVFIENPTVDDLIDLYVNELSKKYDSSLSK